MPADSSDITYANVQQGACYSEAFCQAPCASTFLHALLACEPVAGGYYWGLGSIYLRVHGRQEGACVIDIGNEGEGGVTYYRCTTPLPVRSWKGLQFADEPRMTPNIIDGLACVQIEDCSLFPEARMPCSSDVPICPSQASSC